MRPAHRREFDNLCAHTVAHEDDRPTDAIDRRGNQVRIATKRERPFGLRELSHPGKIRRDPARGWSPQDVHDWAPDLIRVEEPVDQYGGRRLLRHQSVPPICWFVAPDADQLLVSIGDQPSGWAVQPVHSLVCPASQYLSVKRRDEDVFDERVFCG